MDNGNGTHNVSAGIETVYGTDDHTSVMSEKVTQKSKIANFLQLPHDQFELSFLENLASNEA